MRVVPRIEKNAGDEKPGEHEEEIHAGPTPRDKEVMVGKDHEKCDRS
jgi:hypothetical protein